MKVEELPGHDHLAKARLVSDLWEKGLLVTNGPLHPVGDDGSTSEEEEREDEVLQHRYPKFVKVEELPGQDHLAKARLVYDLDPVGDDASTTEEEESEDEV
nr:unnamed protein product [Callosobruchus analis]CAI5868732.1 unnamed protein product [Callosobruchus analis]